VSEKHAIFRLNGRTLSQEPQRALLSGIELTTFGLERFLLNVHAVTGVVIDKGELLLFRG
jgi:hypothetical protein